MKMEFRNILNYNEKYIPGNPVGPLWPGLPGGPATPDSPGTPEKIKKQRYQIMFEGRLIVAPTLQSLWAWWTG